MHAGLVAWGLAIAACAPDTGYYEGFAPLEIEASDIDEETAHPVVGNFVQQEYYLDFRAPAPDEFAELRPEGSTPMEWIPWIRRDDIDVSVQFRLTNLADGPIRAFVLLDGATEFYDWNPVAFYGLAGGEDADEVPFPSLLGFTPKMLEAGEVYEGEYREDDLREAMLDLDVLTRFCGGPFAVLYNRSEVDPVGMEEVPEDAVIAGMGMIRMTLGATGPARLEYAIRVRDRGGRIFDAHTDNLRYEFMPEPYLPPAVAGMAGMTDPNGCAPTEEAP
ncbi:MAG: hypothetical protein D6705_01020 [Deltaproteobacteria bacterium]|nr:MAG: hypothetical protein D6705_01020 [Deltaproteobacteria bacterium]